MANEELIRSTPRQSRAVLSRPCRRGGWFVLAGIVCLAGLAARGADAEVSKEYQVKAAFLYNFTKFVEWPRERFADAGSPIVIGVLGANPFGDELEKLVKGRVVNGRSILVKVVDTVDEARAVHLLFVCADEETHLPTAAWQKAAIVTVGESESFSALGGMITFTREADKVRFEINIAAAERGGLKISSQLQKLATVVRRKP